MRVFTAVVGAGRDKKSQLFFGLRGLKGCPPLAYMMKKPRLHVFKLAVTLHAVIQLGLGHNSAISQGNMNYQYGPLITGWYPKNYQIHMYTAYSTTSFEE